MTLRPHSKKVPALEVLDLRRRVSRPVDMDIPANSVHRDRMGADRPGPRSQPSR